MPTYQYRCTDCGNDLEVVQKFTDDPLTECPACEGRLRKVYNAVGVVFKGSGFYKTDSRSTGKGGAASTAAPSGAGGGTSDVAAPTTSAASTKTESTSTSTSSASTSSSSTASKA